MESNLEKILNGLNLKKKTSTAQNQTKATGSHKPQAQANTHSTNKPQAKTTPANQTNPQEQVEVSKQAEPKSLPETSAPVDVVGKEPALTATNEKAVEAKKEKVAPKTAEAKDTPLKAEKLSPPPIIDAPDMEKVLKELVNRGASDVFLITGRPICYKVNQRIEKYSDEIFFPDKISTMISQIYSVAGRDSSILHDTGDDDFSFAVKGVSRFRINTYKQRGSVAAVIRVVTFTLLDPEALHIPQGILDLANKQYGLVLVTGPSYSGKSTTLSCILDQINEKRDSHIITLEDPIEYLHSHKKSIISQREISLDTKNYSVALRAALRQSPDVILIGELRDIEAISIALTAAETGHYVFSALHSLGAANAIDRLVDTFSATQQAQIRMQLSMVLQTVICQQLLPTLDGGVVPVFEIMHCNNAIRNLIREGRTHQINSYIQSSAAEGMVGMDNSIAKLFKDGIISKQVAYDHSITPDFLRRQIGEL